MADTFPQIAAACGVPDAGTKLRDAFIAGLRAICDAVQPASECTDRAANNTIGPLGNVTNGRAVDVSKVRVEGGEPELQSAEPPKVFVLEWLDPPFDAGHWVPEIVQVRLSSLSGRFHKRP